jgi:hypothetical protein
MSFHLSSTQVELLLGELCIELGFCLPPDEQARLRETPPTEVDAFTDAVIQAEGLDPFSGISLQLRRDIKARIKRHFRAAEDAQQFRTNI